MVAASPIPLPEPFPAAFLISSTPLNNLLFLFFYGSWTFFLVLQPWDKQATS